MTELNCNHDCQKCPGWTLGGETNCLVINEIMKKARLETDIARIHRNNAFKEVENNEKIQG